MANFFEDKDRKIIPNFRSFNLTEKLGDLKSTNIDQSKKPMVDPHFHSLTNDWIYNKTIGFAADLLSTGLLVDPKNEAVISAAQFIIDSKESSVPQKSLAFTVLGNEMTTIRPEEKDLKWFLNYNNNIYKRIAFLKNLIIQFPYNSLNYVEISRLYLILGEKEKAILFMKRALYLGPNNRYILRSAVRLFTHFDEFELPHYYLRKFGNLKNDPWLLSAEIALSSLRKRSSSFIKSGVLLLESKNYSPFSKTELSAAIGTVELLNGSFKNSKKLFSQSLSCPNDNSLAQIEWATNKGGLFNLNPNNFIHVDNKYEAISIDSFHNNDWNSTINNAEKWFIDSPFSKEPTMLGSHVSLTYLDSPEKSIDFCKAGLISHPNDPKLINNLSYSYGLMGDIVNSDRLLRSINVSLVKNDRVKNCLIATKGLIEFRKGNFEIGRKLYLDVIQQTKEKGYQQLNQLATLNYAREELISNKTSKESVLNLIEKLNIPKDDLGLKILKSKVINMAKKL